MLGTKLLAYAPDVFISLNHFTPTNTAEMGRELQKKKDKSSIPKITKRKNRRVHKVRILGNALIAQNWDKTQTLSQNYQRLGLVSRLNKRSGGTEKPLLNASAAASTPPPQGTKLAPGEARIERDGDGNVVKITYGKTAEEALNEDGEEFAGVREAKTDIVRALEEQASYVEKKERPQSEREKEWVQALVEKYGWDYSRMVWDRRLNPFQQSRGDIKRRITKWEKAQKSLGVSAVLLWD